MASQQPSMTSPPTLFHTLLRPCVLQILRAQGYHGARTSVVDMLTDLAARYLYALCEATARSMASSDEGGLVPTLVDVRMALEYCGALMPERVFEEQEWRGEEDTRGVEAFIAWFSGPRNREIRRIALDGDDENTDYLTALKKKHSKTGEDSKYNGTVLGKGNEHGDVIVEGGEFTSIQMWQEKMSKERQLPPLVLPPTPPEAESDSRPPSSGLSSLGDRSIDEMDLS